MNPNGASFLLSVSQPTTRPSNAPPSSFADLGVPQALTAVLAPLAATLGLKVLAVYGGAPIRAQVQALRRGTDVVVATPGRLTDLLRQGACSLDSVGVTVLDEADQMADMGFLPQVTWLLDR